MKTLLLTLALLSSNAFCDSNGPSKEVGNGGFLFSRTSLKLLEKSKESLLSDLSVLFKVRENPSYQSQNCSKNIDLRLLNDQVMNLGYDFDAESSAINPEGKREERYFYINEKGQIVATRVYFSNFVDTYFRYTEALGFLSKEKISSPVRVAIIHEALHLHDYNEIESRACSEELLSKIESYNHLKLKQAKNEVAAYNEQMVSDFLNKECAVFMNKQFQQTYFESHILYSCIVEAGKKYDLQWEKNPFSPRKAIDQLEKGLKSYESLPKVVDGVFRFSFEKKLTSLAE